MPDTVIKLKKPQRIQCCLMRAHCGASVQDVIRSDFINIFQYFIGNTLKSDWIYLDE